MTTSRCDGYGSEGTSRTGQRLRLAASHKIFERTGQFRPNLLDTREGCHVLPTPATHCLIASRSCLGEIVACLEFIVQRLPDEAMPGCSALVQRIVGPARGFRVRCHHEANPIVEIVAQGGVYRGNSRTTG